MAERVGFEPTLRHNRKPDFESGAFDHSATSPRWGAHDTEVRRRRQPRPAADRLDSAACIGASAAMSTISVPVSFGELIDKITILEIKAERIADPAKLAHVRAEMDLLNATWDGHGASRTDIAAERVRLRAINEALWDVEDRIRLKEKARAFDEGFIELARSVYVRNDERAAVKRAINEKLGSTLVEEKSYQDYR